MLTRPPPAPRTRTTGRAPRGAQVRPFGGLSPWPASSSKQMKAPRSRAALLYPATPRPSTPRRRHRRVPWPGGPGPGRTSRAGDPAESPALVTGEPVGQRAIPQLGFQPRKLLRDKPLPRHRLPGLQCPGAAVPPGPPPPAYRPFGDPQVPGDLAGRVAAGEPLSCPQPQPPAPLLLGRCIPAALPISHAPFIRRQPADITSRSLRVHLG